MTHLLHTLNFPEDLKSLSVEALESLAQEIRNELIKIGDACGGHLASNLGVVELTLVMHTLFNSPQDRFLWDTSHQTYVHKMLTGRLDQMFTIRQDGGLSGFSKISESPHDAFGAGHASTALSASLGFAHARDIQNENYHVISVIGDASFSGGMTFEALNNVATLKSNLICILNDNDMSISRPVGNMADYITKVRTSPLYTQMKKNFGSVIESIPKFGENLKRIMERSVDHLRDVVLDTRVGVMFEDFGFKYIGPIDGHDIPTLMATLSYAKAYPGPIMIHVITQKGKGHEAAEADPETYHGVSPKPTQPASAPPAPKVPTFTAVFGKTMERICDTRKDIVVVTPAMEGGSGLTPFKNHHPKQFFDVGIAEEHAVTFCAGLARGGILPVLAIYSTFLQRGYDQMVHDVCLQNLPVIFALDRAGLVGQDGPTHHGVLDYCYMLPIPNLMILAPKDGEELDRMLSWAVDQHKAISIRYPRGSVPKENGQHVTPLQDMTSEILYTPATPKPEVLILAAGTLAWPAYQAAQELAEASVHCTVVNLRFIKPLDIKTLAPLIESHAHVLVLEEGNGIGGVFHYILHQVPKSTKPLSSWHQLALDDTFVDHGQQSTLNKEAGFDCNGIKAKVRNLLNL